MNVICAYPVNLDAVHNVRGEEIASLARGLVPEAKERITSREDLISALLFCMQEGSGGELLIEGERVASLIESSFQWLYRLGGNAGIMANVLATLGALPVLNAPALSRRMAGMLHPAVRVPVSGSLKEPLIAAGETEMVHFVLQFTEGETVTALKRSIVAPKDNRLIATFDPLNSRLCSSPDFDAYCLDRIDDFDGAIVSGFHLVPLSRYQEIFEQKIAQIESWRKARPGLYIHAEMGNFQQTRIMEHLLPRLPVDSLGMNEDELAAVAGTRPGWQGILKAAEHLRHDLDLFRVCVHTGDLILSVMRGSMPPEDEVRALIRGADAAASLAATGSVRGPPPAEVNPIGMQAREEFRRDGAKASGRGAFMNYGEVVVSLVPSLLARRPRFTVGLGDTTTAAIFHEEMQALKDHSI